LNTSFEIFHSVNELDQKLWNSNLDLNHIFLESEFLKNFEKNLNEKEIQPFYINFENGVVYGHLITIEGEKVANYISNKKYSLTKLFIRKLNLKFFCFGNTHLSNISSNSFPNSKLKEEDLKNLIDFISTNYKINFFLLPSDFLNSITKQQNLLLSSEFNIDPDMVLYLDSKWKSFGDYTDAVVSKYKKRIRKVFKQSNSLQIKKISTNKIESLIPELQELYLNVYRKSLFSGPPLDLHTLIDFSTYSKIEFSLYTYSLNEEIIGFSSEFHCNNTLYSYFIGIDYSYNKEYSIYNRILYDSIIHGIEKKVSKIVYGRTASEFKSTIGAIPLESESSIYSNNAFLRFLTYPFIKKISPKKWIQRYPFKKKK
jgi:predicted N-acyltransferase